jgi:hypothetical protein
MPRIGFERTIPESKRAKTVNASDHWATVTGLQIIDKENIVVPLGDNISINSQ